MEKPKAVGIDLGTTYSCVGVFENGRVEIIANARGDRTTPSVVAYIGGQRTVGQNAKNQMAEHPLNVITCAKRLIGRKFNDPKVQKVIEDLPYKIVSLENGNTAVEVEYGDETRTYTPEEVSARVLFDIKQTAVNHLGGKMNDTLGAVITIPGYFNDSQRQATIDAAKIAKIDVLRIINEPTAAALAYAYKKKWKNGIILVYDLGGGTFDVSIIKVTDGCCEVLAVDGDDHLGGEDFDNLMVKYCLEVFQHKHGHDLSNNAEAVCRIKAKCEVAKRNLSNIISSSIEIGKLYNGEDLRCKINQARFNEICKDLFEKTLRPVRSVLEEAKLAKSDIDNVVLVGGSTRIPFIQKTLTEFFDDKKLNFDINPDEAVASGAAILAAHLSKSFDTSIQNIRLLDVIPRSLGIHTKYVDFFVTVPRFTKFPCEIVEVFCNTKDNQRAVRIDVYEGEDSNAKNNKLLGTFNLLNITPAPVGVTKINVFFKIDDNGILTVTAVDQANGNSNSVTIFQDKGRLTDDQLVRMIDEVYPPIMEFDLDND